MRILALFICIFAFATSAFSRSLTPDETAQLEQRLERFITALEEKDMAEIVTILPPRFMSFLAKKAGVEEAIISKMMIGQMRQTLQEAVLHEPNFEKSNLEVVDVSLADGTPVSYVLIPFSFILEMRETKMAISQSVLAVLEQGNWYLLRIENPVALDFLKQIYPFIQDIDFPPSTKKILSQ